MGTYFPGYLTGGMDWMANLNAPDPTYTLPIITSASMIVSRDTSEGGRICTEMLCTVVAVSFFEYRQCDAAGRRRHDGLVRFRHPACSQYMEVLVGAGALSLLETCLGSKLVGSKI